MRKSLIYLFVFSLSYSFSQTLDFNTKGGFAVNGYDVVSYFHDNPEKGSNDFALEHDGVKYKFASQKNMADFRENPEKYLPQYGGYCAYAVALKSKKVSVNPKTFEVIDGKLYLFYNAWGTNTLELWRQENVKELIKKGDKGWELLKFL